MCCAAEDGVGVAVVVRRMLSMSRPSIDQHRLVLNIQCLSHRGQGNSMQVISLLHLIWFMTFTNENRKMLHSHPTTLIVLAFLVEKIVSLKTNQEYERERFLYFVLFEVFLLTFANKNVKIYTSR